MSLNSLQLLALASLGASFLFPLAGWAEKASGVPSRVLYVDATRGDDTRTGSEGAPLRTLAKAISLARPGDTIRLEPGQPPIHEEVILSDRSGEPGRPITLDGGGNLLDGQRPIVPSEWEKVGPGLYRHGQFAPSLFRHAPSAAMLRRFYFIFNGRLERMGSVGKGANLPLPPPRELQPGQWSYVEGERAFYLAINPEQELADARIGYPALLNGVATRGDCRHWVIERLTVKHFLNDGFNLHGITRDFLLRDVAAIHCGDDGLSAHGDCEFVVEGFTARGNATGICHIGKSRGTHRRLRLEENVTYNLCLLGTGSHTVSDSVVSARGGVIRLGSKREDGLEVRFERVEILWPDEGQSPSVFQLEEKVRFTSDQIFHPRQG